MKKAKRLLYKLQLANDQVLRIADEDSASYVNKYGSCKRSENGGSGNQQIKTDVRGTAGCTFSFS